MSWIQIWKKSKRLYGWRHVSKACERLSYMYDHPIPVRVIALARGGLVPATIIANRLGVRHVYSLGLSSYVQQDDGSESPGEFDLYQSIPTNIKRLDKQQHILLIDDISDKGTTFKFAKRYVHEMLGGTIITMSLTIKPETNFKPDYYDEVVDQDQWLVFPWEIK